MESPMNKSLISRSILKEMRVPVSAAKMGVRGIDPVAATVPIKIKPYTGSLRQKPLPAKGMGSPTRPTITGEIAPDMDEITNIGRKQRMKRQRGSTHRLRMSRVDYYNLREGLWDKLKGAVGKLASKVKSSKLAQRAGSHAVQGAKEVGGDTLKIIGANAAYLGGHFIPGAKRYRGAAMNAAMTGGEHINEPAKTFGPKFQKVIHNMGMKGKVVTVPHNMHEELGAPSIKGKKSFGRETRERVHQLRGALRSPVVHAVVPKQASKDIRAAGEELEDIGRQGKKHIGEVKAMAGEAGQRIKSSVKRAIRRGADHVEKSLGRVVGPEKAKRVVDTGREIAHGVSQRVKGAAEKFKQFDKKHANQEDMNAFYYDHPGVRPQSIAAGMTATAAARKLVGVGNASNAVAAAVDAVEHGFNRAKLHLAAHHPNKRVRKVARKIIAGKQPIYPQENTKGHLGIMSHELGHAANYDEGGMLHKTAHRFSRYLPGGDMVEEARASLKAKKAMRGVVPKEERKKHQRFLQLGLSTRVIPTIIGSPSGFAGIESLSIIGRAKLKEAGESKVSSAAKSAGKSVKKAAKKAPAPQPQQPMLPPVNQGKLNPNAEAFKLKNDAHAIVTSPQPVLAARKSIKSPGGMRPTNKLRQKQQEEIKQQSSNIDGQHAPQHKPAPTKIQQLGESLREASKDFYIKHLGRHAAALEKYPVLQSHYTDHSERMMRILRKKAPDVLKWPAISPDSTAFGAEERKARAGVVKTTRPREDNRLQGRLAKMGRNIRDIEESSKHHEHEEKETPAEERKEEKAKKGVVMSKKEFKHEHKRLFRALKKCGEKGKKELSKQKKEYKDEVNEK